MGRAAPSDDLEEPLVGALILLLRKYFIFLLLYVLHIGPHCTARDCVELDFSVQLTHGSFPCRGRSGPHNRTLSPHVTTPLPTTPRQCLAPGSCAPHPPLWELPGTLPPAFLQSRNLCNLLGLRESRFPRSRSTARASTGWTRLDLLGTRGTVDWLILPSI